MLLPVPMPAPPASGALAGCSRRLPSLTVRPQTRSARSAELSYALDRHHRYAAQRPLPPCRAQEGDSFQAWLAGGEGEGGPSGSQEAAGRRDDRRVPATRPSADTAAVQRQREQSRSYADARDVGAARGSCYGCGVRLQTRDPAAAGHVDAGAYAIKQRHRQLDQLLCHRCQALSNGAMIPAVADFARGSAPAGAAAAPFNKALITPEQLREELRPVQFSRAVVVLLVDLLDASGSMLGRVRELVGNNPIMLVGTKADLLPGGADLAAVAEWLAAAAEFKRLAVASVHLVSSKGGEPGVARAVADLRKERRGRDVYVVGAANVGKSAFIRALVKDMAKMSSRQYDPAALDKAGRLPVESALPGTTLRTIPLEVFSSGGTLFDTPGLHLHHRAPHLLTPDENKALHPAKRLKAFVAPTPAEVAAAAEGVGAASNADEGQQGGEELEGGAAVGSYSWGGLARIDVLACPADTRLVFYGPKALRVVAAPGARHLRAGPAATDAGVDEFGAASVAARGGLRVAKMASVPAGYGMEEAVADVAVSGVPGWVAVFSRGRPGERVQLRVLAPKGVEVYVRPPLPVPAPLVSA